MAVTKLLGLLLTLQFMMNTVSTAGIKSRQLDIPAFKAFFSQIQSHLVNDKDQGSTGTGAVSVKIEGLNPPPATSSDWGVNSTFVKNANIVDGNDSNFGVSVIRDSETSNRNLHRQNDGKTKAAPVVEVKRPESDFRSISSSSHGSFVLNHKRPASSAISTKGNSLGGKSEPLPFHSHQPAPIQPIKFHEIPSPSHPTSHSPQTTANQAAFTRAVPFQGPPNVRAAPTVKAASNDWIPISQPNGSPVTSSYSQLSTSSPISSNGPILEDPADNFDPFKFNNDNSNKKERENNAIGSTASNDANDVVDNLSDPSFLRGLRLKNPETPEPLYGQVVSPPQGYAPARKPFTKHTYKAPHPLNINQIIAEAVDHKPPIQQQQQQQPGYKSSKPSIKGKLKTNFHSTYGAPENSLNGNGGGNGIHNMGNPFPYPPIKTDPSFRQLNGPSNDPHSPVQNNFDDGLRDDVGKVSSFSYFRNLGPDAPGSKGFDQAFNVHAGRNIAKQFKQHMFDQTGFPGKIQ